MPEKAMSTNPETMTQAQVAEWFKAARRMMGDELADMMATHLTALDETRKEMVRALSVVIDREDPYSDSHKAATAALRKAGEL